MKITIKELRRRITHTLIREWDHDQLPGGSGGMTLEADDAWLHEADDDKDEGEGKGKDASGDDEESGADEKPDDALGDMGSEDDQPEGSSLDAQVDHYLIEYEKAAGKAKKASAQTEGRDRSRRMTRSFLLREADEDSEVELPADVGGPEARGAVDIESFAGSVARLIENFDSMVEVRKTVLRRAEGFLRKTHSDDDVQRFMDSMRDQHGIDPEKSQYDMESDIDTPPAVGAGVPTGGGV